MAGRRSSWRIRLSEAAETDFRAILAWTADQFGKRQAEAYERTLSEAIQELEAGPAVRGAKPRDEICDGLFTLHVSRRRRRGRHFILFRAGRESGPPVIEVVRILHDSMDLARHAQREGPSQ